MTIAATFPARPAGLARRLAAILYDALLLFAVLCIATVLALPLNGGQAFRHNPVYTAYVYLICFLFFGWFWTHGGQTLGMRAWKLRLVRYDGEPVGWRQALLRFLLASLWLLPLLYLRHVAEAPYQAGLIAGFSGWFVLLLSRLPDHYSGAVVVQLPPAGGTAVSSRAE